MRTERNERKANDCGGQKYDSVLVFIFVVVFFVFCIRCYFCFLNALMNRNENLHSVLNYAGIHLYGIERVNGINCLQSTALMYTLCFAIVLTLHVFIWFLFFVMLLHVVWKNKNHIFSIEWCVLNQEKSSNVSNYSLFVVEIIQGKICVSFLSKFKLNGKKVRRLVNIFSLN